MIFKIDKITGVFKEFIYHEEYPSFGYYQGVVIVDGQKITINDEEFNKIYSLLHAQQDTITFKNLKEIIKDEEKLGKQNKEQLL